MSKMKSERILILAVLFVSTLVPTLARAAACDRYLLVPGGDMPQVEAVSVLLDGLKIGSLSDASGSTGATVFYFPSSANVAYDARGGSVASSETTLFDQGSYSNNIDAIVFAGGSTMGLAAGDGVRRELFQQRAREQGTEAGAFDLIASVPTAVVYDFGARIHRGANELVYPDSDLGSALMQNLSNKFMMGRAGAGTSTSVNKGGAGCRWGGQGAAVRKYSWGTVFAAVALNACGDVIDGGDSYTGQFPSIPVQERQRRAGMNTTLSMIATDVPLDRNQLKRLSVAVHTSMAGSIRPFQTYTDGDINFAASIVRPGVEPRGMNDDLEWQLMEAGSALMREAILGAVRVANTIPTTVAKARKAK